MLQTPGLRWLICSLKTESALAGESGSKVEGFTQGTSEAISCPPRFVDRSVLQAMFDKSAIKPHKFPRAWVPPPGVSRTYKGILEGPILFGPGSTGDLADIEIKRSSNISEQSTNMQIAAGQWRFKNCAVTCVSGVAMLCVDGGQVSLDKCLLGGIGRGRGEASNGIAAMNESIWALQVMRFRAVAPNLLYLRGQYDFSDAD